MTTRHEHSLISILALCGIVWNAGCGGLGPIPVALNDNTTDEAACLDLWSLVHFLSGYYIADQLGEDSFLPTTALLTAYEVVEPHFWPGFNESNLNQQCDIAVGMLGGLAEQASQD